MVTIDRFEEILETLAEELPAAFTSSSTAASSSIRPSAAPGGPARRPVYHGQYRTDPAMGQYIVMFYGSFRRVLRGADESEWVDEMRDVLRHEFRHHIEGMAGVRDLEIWTKSRSRPTAQRTMTNGNDKTGRADRSASLLKKLPKAGAFLLPIRQMQPACFSPSASAAHRINGLSGGAAGSLFVTVPCANGS